MRSIRSLSLLSLVVAFSLLTACTPVAVSSVNTAAAPSMTAAAGEDLNAASYPVLLEALERQRPAMLRERGGSDRLMFEIDGTLVERSALRTIRTADVATVERVAYAGQRGQTVVRVRLR